MGGFTTPAAVENVWAKPRRQHYGSWRDKISILTDAIEGNLVKERNTECGRSRIRNRHIDVTASFGHQIKL